MRGWPKIVIEVWEVSYEGRYSIAGYGIGTIPCTPGTHNIVIKCWRPTDTTTVTNTNSFDGLSSWFGFLSQWILGNRPELSNKDILLSSAERNGFETETTGTVIVEVGVITKDFELYGVKLS